jgi:branched-chain amino acid transport system substrate-binding protein
LATVKKYDGITGTMAFDGKSGDPVKCAVMVKISQEGKFEFYSSVCP